MDEGITKIYQKILSARKMLAATADQKFEPFSIPIILFTEMSEKLGSGDMRTVIEGMTEYVLRDLAPKHPAVDFPGAISLRKYANEGIVFGLWETVPKKEEGSFNSRPILEIVGGEIWKGSHGRYDGRLLTKEAAITISIYEFSAQNPVMKLISFIMFRANQLASSPDCLSESYWERDRHPDRFEKEI